MTLYQNTVAVKTINFLSLSYTFQLHYSIHFVLDWVECALTSGRTCAKLYTTMHVILDCLTYDSSKIDIVEIVWLELWKVNTCVASCYYQTFDIDIRYCKVFYINTYIVIVEDYRWRCVFGKQHRKCIIKLTIINLM